MLNVGVKLGGTYRLESLIGKGGMGEVWLASHLLLNQPRAIKIMLGEIATNELARERFIQGEARNALQLESHPALVRVYELGLHEEMPYIVMEYVEPGPQGGTLKDWLRKKGRLGLAETLQVLKPICAGLDVAHRLGIVHRDIKPANVLLNKQGQPKLTDFGLTKDLEDEIDITGSHGSMGTPAYMAPEQARGQSGKSGDIYSLGVMLFEMLTGRLPFVGSTASVLVQHATDAPPALQAVDPTLPASVNTVIMKALAKSPQERYSSAGELAVAFEQATQQRGGVWPVPPSQTLDTQPLAPPKPPATDNQNHDESLAQYEEMARQFLNRAKPPQPAWQEKADVSPWPAVPNSDRKSSTENSSAITKQLNQFNEAYTQADWDAAIEAGEKLLRMASDNSSIRASMAAAYSARGHSLYEKGYFRWAVNDFTRAVQLEPGQAEYRYHLAKSYFGLRLGSSDGSKRGYNLAVIEQAMREIGYAIQLEAGRAEYYYLRYRFYMALENREAALPDLQKAAELGHAVAKKEWAEARGFWRRFLPR